MARSVRGSSVFRKKANVTGRISRSRATGERAPCSRLGRVLFAAVLLLLIGCDSETPDEPSGPVLLAQLPFDVGQSTCCAEWPEPVGVAICLVYGAPEFEDLGGAPPVRAAILLGCDRTHLPGSSQATTSYTQENAGYAAIVSRLTDVEDEEIVNVIVAVDRSFGRTEPAGGALDRESDMIQDAASLQGAQIDSIRLMVTALSAMQQTVPLGRENSMAVTGVWQFWGTRR